MNEHYELMQHHCATWDELYVANSKTKELVNGNPPFAMVWEHGKLFNHSNSKKLKSDEELLLNKAIKRIGNFEKSAALLALNIPVRICFHENNTKLKLFHGLLYNTDTSSSTELSWLMVNDTLVDVANDIKGQIPTNFIYFGLEIPKPILNTTILTYGLGISTDSDYQIKPNKTTVLMKGLKDLTTYYNV